MVMLASVTTSTSTGGLLLMLVVLGLGLGITMTPINVMAMNAVPHSGLGAASGLLSTSRGLATAFGVAASGALFEVIHVNHTVSIAAAHGLTLTADTARSVDGILVGTDGAQETVAGLALPFDEIVGIAREAFADAFQATMILSGGVAAIALVLALAVLARRRGGQETARPIVEPSDAITNTAISTPMTHRMIRSPREP
jgi:hypothetical protein